jgi:hypothetical protein
MLQAGHSGFVIWCRCKRPMIRELFGLRSCAICNGRIASGPNEHAGRATRRRNGPERIAPGDVGRNSGA